MKKILSLVLAMLMIISMVPAVFAADAGESDYQAAIDYLKTIGLYVGYGDGEDGADDQVLRYQMALFTARMVTGRVDKAYWATEENDSGFTDVDALDEEALGGVSYAAQQGIVNGIGGGEFAPYDNVTYRDAIVMIVRALGFNYPASGYPWSYINKARELGVLDGISGVTYTVEVKREVIAQLLYNALNAEIKGATLAETAFGVAETIVMVTATTDIAYGKGASKSQKADYVKVAALDAEGEPFGVEYYVPAQDLGLDAKTANAAVGTTFALTHKDNFQKVLASESLSKVFENTTSKKEITYTFENNKIMLGRTQYTILAPGVGYSNLNNNQGTVTGNKEIKVFKAFGAEAENLIPANAQYLMGADGNIYSVDNPFVPYAVYSALIDAYFTYDVTEAKWVKLSDKETEDLLALTKATVEGFSNIGTAAYINTKLSKDEGAPYDYFKAIASDVNGDGVYDRVIIRPYELFRVTAKSSDGKTATLVSYTAPVNGANTLSTPETITLADWRLTGIAMSNVAADDFIVAYMADGLAKERELEIVEVVGGAKADDEDKTYVFNAYLRGYDATTNSVIFGSNYETLPFGYMGVINTSAYVPALVKAATATTSATANYLRQYWNTYVTMYVLNGKVIMVQPASDVDNYVVIKSFTDFTENGLKAVAYSTLTDGEAEITISELNGWNLGGFDYDLFQWLKKLADAGLDVTEYPLPIDLYTVYKVRYVAEDGSYNLVGATSSEPQNIYVNNYGYILGVDANGTFGSDKRVPTSDKDLWIIVQGKQIHCFKGKLSSVELFGLEFYKAKDNQFVAVAPAGANLGPIYGNVNQGVEYWMYNYEVDMYYNKYYYANFNYGHYMTNMRTGTVEFVTYDSALATAGFNGTLVPMTEGAIYKATDKVISEYSLDANKKVVIPTYSMKSVAATEFGTGKYFGKSFATYTVGAGLKADFTDFGHDQLKHIGATQHFESFADLRDAIAINMYEEIYDRDFTNIDQDTGMNVDSWEAIKQDLLENVLFIDRTADGKRTYTFGADSELGILDISIGDAGSVVPAYVMYDYANNSARVFFDSYETVVLTDEDPVKATIAGVEADVVYARNYMANTTKVTVTFAGKHLVDLAVTIDEGRDLYVQADGFTYIVDDAEYEGVPTATASKVTERVALSNVQLINMSDRSNNLGLTTDGNYMDEPTAHAWIANVKDFKVDALTAQLADARDNDDVVAAPYFSALVYDLKEETDLTYFSMAILGLGDDPIKNTYRNFDILVMVDGEWVVAASEDDIYGDTTKWIWNDKSDDSKTTVYPGYFTYTTALDAAKAEGATKIALAFRRVIDTETSMGKDKGDAYGYACPAGTAPAYTGTDVNYGSWLFLIEFEALK